MEGSLKGENPEGGIETQVDQEFLDPFHDGLKGENPEGGIETPSLVRSMGLPVRLKGENPEGGIETCRSRSDDIPRRFSFERRESRGRD